MRNERYYSVVRIKRTTRYSGERMGNRPTWVALLLLVAAGVALDAQLRPMVPVDPPRTEKEDPVQRIVALDARWTLAFDSAPSASAGYDQHAAYVPLKGGELVAVDLDSGKVRWKVELATAFSPATGDGLVFAAGDAIVLAYEERTGTTTWRTPVDGPLAAPVYFDAGTLLVTRMDGELVALNAQDGAVLWRRQVGAPLLVEPAAAGDRFFVALEDGRVLALARDSGEPAWTYTIPDPITGMLALDDQLIVGTRGNRLYSLGMAKGRALWQQKAGADISGAAVADEDHIYFTALDNLLRALNRRNGNLLWMAKLPSRPAGGPVRTGNVVIVPTVSADIGAYSALTGKQTFTIKAAGEISGVPFIRETPRPTAPRLIAVSLDGKLQGFAPRYEPPPSLLAPEPFPGVRVGS